MFYCYILYSPKLDKFYIGSTSLQPSERLGRHLNEFYGINKYTAKTKDWELFFSIECSTKGQAQKVESHIKKMKSKTYIKNIRKYPDISIKLLEKFK